MIQVLKIVVTGRFESAVLLGQFAFRVALNCKNVSPVTGWWCNSKSAGCCIAWSLKGVEDTRDNLTLVGS